MMPIEFKTGDMFDEPTEAIVNTVNCVGVMGKGVALEFKRRWPDNFKEYKKRCSRGEILPGRVFVFDNNDMLSNGTHRFLINFPTKVHWRSQSKIEYIREGLDDFVSKVEGFGIKSVSLPPLGCGNGGLDWLHVRPIIEEKLSKLSGVRVVVFLPKDVDADIELGVSPKDLTVGRATMMVAFAELEKFFGGHLTRLTAQKLTYFLQILGVDFGMSFVKEKYGPYSEKLHKVFKLMEEKRYIYGYSGEDRKVVVSAATYAAANEFLMNARVDVSPIIEKLSLLIEGYETPYGMELLSSVHFLFVSQGIVDQPAMSEALEAWNDHKRESFPEKAVTAALSRLKSDGLIVV